MFSFRKVIICLSVFLVSVPVFSQTSYPKTLLWRISGNGLQKPSYLFGTMHLNDKRLFRFADSVYSAIEKSDGLAIELSPDELAAFYITKMFDDLEKGKKLNTVLNDNDFKKYSKALSKKFNKPADEITTRDIVKEKNKWVAEYLEKGEMPTFVDAYLYNIARRQGKWMGGIEDVADQQGLDELIDKSDIDYLLAGDKTIVNAGMEKMIDTYVNQDLNGIEAISDHQSKEEKDLLLIKRNGKMARRIDSLANIRTMFFAIGAAHLPGTQGVISLLKSRGFTVDPVLSARKIDPQDYKVKEVPVNWTDITDANGLYTAKMPGNPTPVKLYGIIEMKFLLDIFSLSGYCTAAMISPAEFKTPDSLFGNMVKGMFPGKKNIASKNIDKDGIIGREYLDSRDGETMRVQLLMYKRVVYMVMMSSSKKETLTSANANKFFESFIINKNSVTKTPASSYQFTDSIMGISFNSPTPVTYNEKFSNEDDSWRVKGFGGTDIANGIYIMLFSKDVKPGRYIVNDSILNDYLYKNMQKQYPDITIKSTSIQGNPVTMFYGLNEQQKNIAAKIVNAIKGNRNILLMVIADTVHMKSPGVEDIFSSFKFIENKSPEWKTNASPDKSFSTWAPSVFYKNESETYTTRNETQYISYDTSLSTTYSVTIDTLSKYYWAKSDSAFWNEKTKAWYTDEDTLLMFKKTQNAELTGAEILIEKRRTNVYKRVRILLDGDKTYALSTSSQKDLLYTTHADKFFSDFKVAAPAKAVNISQSKAGILLADLNAEDSAKRSQSSQALYNANFSETDVPLLHEALFKKYIHLYDSSENTYINSRIANHLESLSHPATISFIEEKYKTLTPSLKVIALSTLAGIHNKESYRVFGQLLNDAGKKDAPGYQFASNLKDSLALTATIFPQLIALAKDSLYGPEIAGVLLTLMDSGFVKQDAVAEYEKDFIGTAKNLLPSLKVKDSEPDYSVYELIELLARLNTDSSISTLKKYQYVFDNYLKKEAVMHLLKKGYKAETTVINNLAADIAIRSNFYDDLKEIKKQSLFPAQFLTQKAFAESAVYNASQDEDDDGGVKPSVTFISEKIASCKDKKYKFYLFKVTYGKGKDDTSYLGIAGGYPLTGNSLEEKQNFTGIYWEKEYTTSNISTDFNSYLKQFDKEDSDSENTNEE